MAKSKEERISDYDDADGGNYRAGLVSELAAAERKLAVADDAADAEAAAVAKQYVKDVKAELARLGVNDAQIDAHRAETRI